MSQTRKKTAVKEERLSESGGKKPFEEPKIKVYKKLEDITLFTSTQNVSGGTFF